jgi:hypothetical protein
LLGDLRPLVGDSSPLAEHVLLGLDLPTKLALRRALGEIGQAMRLLS